MRSVSQALETWLESGGRSIGEIIISKSEAGWELRHAADAGRDDLELSSGPNAARALANFDAGGAFRPLKTAPSLIRGWRLEVSGIEELRRALDYFYPAMLGCGLSFQTGDLHGVPLRETLSRQTGMYRVTQKVTDEDARETVSRACGQGCLKRRLWELETRVDLAGASPPNEWPLLCQEACNLLVAEIRKVVKSKPIPP